RCRGVYSAAGPWSRAACSASVVPGPDPWSPWRNTMRRPALTFAAALCCLALPMAAFAQSSKSAAATPVKKDVTPAVAPAAPPSPELLKARMRPPVKGTAYLEVIPGQSKKVGGEVVTVTKVKNVSDAPIVGLRVDEWWYAKGQQ